VSTVVLPRASSVPSDAHSALRCGLFALLSSPVNAMDIGPMLVQDSVYDHLGWQARSPAPTAEILAECEAPGDESGLGSCSFLGCCFPLASVGDP
jgi:hypothetical protein